MRRLFAINWYH